MRPPIHWFGGEGMVLAFRAVQEMFGEDAQIQEVRVTAGDAQIMMEDTTAPGKIITLASGEMG